MRPVQTHTLCLFTILAIALSACDALSGEDYDPLHFSSDGQKLIATGAIDSSSPSAFTEALRQSPNAQVLVLQNIPGSVDDDANLEMARAIRISGLDTFVPRDGMVASGGTDLFLAGVKRTAEAGACFGVHSWSSGPDTPKATDLPSNHEEHQKYLSYYDTMGIPKTFYWYTLKAAPAEGIHWMSAQEINTYHMTTEPMPTATSPTSRCDAR